MKIEINRGVIILLFVLILMFIGIAFDLTYINIQTAILLFLIVLINFLIYNILSTEIYNLNKFKKW